MRLVPGDFVSTVEGERLSSYITSQEFVTRIVREVVHAKSGLTPDEIRELGIAVESKYSIERAASIFRIRWSHGDDAYRQLDFFMDDTDMVQAANATDIAAAFASRATESANLRAELQFHRLARRLPKRIKEVRIGPSTFVDHHAPAGHMLVIFNSGAVVVCSELEATTDEFIAKCLMLT